MSKAVVSVVAIWGRVRPQSCYLPGPRHWQSRCSLSDRAIHLSAALLIGSILGLPNAAKAADVNPLRPIDTSSPRATLQDFVVTMDGAYRGMKEIMQEYAASHRLYPTADERHRRVELLSAAAKATKVLDLSGFLPCCMRLSPLSGQSS